MICFVTRKIDQFTWRGREWSKTLRTLTITRHAVRNYGSVLQAYATQRLVEEAGSRCTTVDFRRAGVGDDARSYRQKESTLGGLGKDLAYRALRSHGARARGVVFENFLERYLELSETRYSSFDALKAEEWRRDSVYCVGADQVWNIEQNRDNRPYYLDFLPEGVKRFSFASSIGMSRLPATEELKMIGSLQQFSGVSVRESSAVDYLESLGVSAVHHLDPTLVLSARQWRTFAEGVRLHKDPYVLVYQLNSNPTLQAAALAIGRSLGIPVVRVEYWLTMRGRGARTVMRPSVEEFVGLLRDATVLVCDSFHGAAFALNFGTKLVSVPPPNYRGRIDSLLTQFALEGCRARTINEAVEIANDDDIQRSIEPLLTSERERARRYVSSMVNSSPSPSRLDTM